MTIDYAEPQNNMNKNGTAENNRYDEVDSAMLKKEDDDDNSHSQLTVETEKMVPLAATDCLLSKKSAASIASSSQIMPPT